MLKFIEEKLSAFKTCFTRTATYRWFVVVIVGLMTRTDFLGVTSLIRCLGIHPGRYESLLHFFRSDAFSTKTLKNTWFQAVLHDHRLYKINSRTLLLGDGTKQPKEGHYMPGVKKQFQESENSSKPPYFFGHMYGGIGAVINQGSSFFCIPLDMNIQDGLKETDSWKQGSCHDAASHVIQMIRNGYEAADTFGSSYLVLDRYFLTVPALTELNQLNQSAHLLDVITRAKSSCIAYEIPKADRTPRRGRPRKKGEPIKLNTLFEDRASDFISAEVMMYGKKETVQYLCLDLLWGTRLYKKLRFVLVKYAKSSAILVSTDLSLNPVLIIEAYAHRFKIECTFREFKQQIGGFCYHFWTKAMPKLNKNKKKTDTSELSGVVEEDKRSRILKTVEATERFILCSCIAMGLVQMMALTPSMAKTVRRHRYLRTSSEHKVSEASVLEYLRKNFFRLLCLNPNSEISRFILTLQPLEYSGNDDFMSA